MPSARALTYAVRRGGPATFNRAARPLPAARAPPCSCHLSLIAVSILAGLGIAIGLLLLIIPGLILLTLWAVVAPVTVLERPGVLAVFGRSRELVRGNGWQVFGVIVLFILIFIAIGIVLGIIGAVLGDAGEVILNYVGSVITAPLVALASAVLYFELRAPGPEVPVAPQ